MSSISQQASSPLAQDPSMSMSILSQPQFGQALQNQPSTPFGAPNQIPSLGPFAPFGQPSFNACDLQSTGITPTPGSKRKRSRDDDEGKEDSEDDYFPRTVAPSIENDEWEYGEGMTLRRKGAPPQHIEAGSQSGTWAEEQLAKSRFPSPPRTIERPIIRNHKSARKGLSSDSAGIEYAPKSSPTRQSSISGPTVDNFTLHLGIGWSKISDDADMQAAARGWAKYIENHFPVTSPAIILKSRALESYLVEAKEGWFLFGEELKQGRFVAPTFEQACVHLRTSPPTFEGAEILDAKEQNVEMSISTPSLTSSMTPEIDSEAEEYGDEPHCYESSMAKRKAYLATLGEGAGEGLGRPATAGSEGQVPELIMEDDAMDMS